MTLCLLAVHLRTFLSIPVTQKCQILRYDTFVANERYADLPQTGSQYVAGRSVVIAKLDIAI